MDICVCPCQDQINWLMVTGLYISGMEVMITGDDWEEFYADGVFYGRGPGWGSTVQYIIPDNTTVSS